MVLRLGSINLQTGRFVYKQPEYRCEVIDIIHVFLREAAHKFVKNLKSFQKSLGHQYRRHLLSW